MPNRLHLPQIERKPKAVFKVSSYRCAVDLKNKTHLQTAIIEIRKSIINGTPLPVGSYRKSTGRDFLLEQDGIMHLHLGDSSSSELLYLVQYSDHVVFLEINTHYHFTTKPAGIVLERMHGKKIDEINASIFSKKSEIASEKAEAIKKALSKRRRGQWFRHRKRLDD